MLLEVNALRALIIARPPSPDLHDDQWREIFSHYQCLVLVSDTASFNEWLDLFGDTTAVYFWDREAANEVAGNIRSSLETLGREPHESAYITFEEADLIEAIPTRIGTIQIGANFQGILPDVYCDDVIHLAEVLEHHRRGRHRGYVAELESTMTGPNERWGGDGIIVSYQGFLAHVPELDPTIAGELFVAVLGRYFSPRGDLRFAKHQLSQRILKAKAGDQRARPLLKPLGSSIRHLVDTHGFEVITTVPPRPSADRDTLGKLLEALTRSPRYTFTDVDIGPTLECIRDYEPQKARGSRARRVQNVAGAFLANRRVDGQRILIVDDILTSGATIVSSAAALLDAGAGAVGALAIEYNQRHIHRDSGFPCPETGCNGTMKLRLGNKVSTAFWGCSNWQEPGCNCDARMSFRRGMFLYNNRNRAANIDIVPEISF